MPTLIQSRLENYQCETALDETQAIREITQELVLYSLYQAQFFKVASFLGGTALRIIYQLNRFSEDLDFSLLKPDLNFNITSVIKSVVQSMKAFGYDLEVMDKSKTDIAVKNRWLKTNFESIGKIFEFHHHRDFSQTIKIKLEVDCNPPLGAETEMKFLDFPADYQVLAHNKPCLFSGKIMALLCRAYIKGRDWYDFLWYVKEKVTPDWVHLNFGLNQNGPWKNKTPKTSPAWLEKEMKKKIRSLDWKKTAEDVRPFLKENEESLQFWSEDFFLEKLEKLIRSISDKYQK